jgi:hypothetical protein
MMWSRIGRDPIRYCLDLFRLRHQDAVVFHREQSFTRPKPSHKTMTSDLSFKDAVQLVRDENISDEFINDLDQTLGLLIILSPLMAAGGQISFSAATSAWKLITTKNEVVKIGRRVTEKLIGSEDTNHERRVLRMRAAHTVICATSFFAALDRVLPQVSSKFSKRTIKRFALTDAAKDALREILSDASVASVHDVADLSTTPIPLPHPADSFKSHTGRILRYYAEMTHGLIGFLRFIKLLPENATDNESVIGAALRTLPQLALEQYKTQYYELAAISDDFFIWANLQEHEEFRSQVTSVSVFLQEYVTMAERHREHVDVGMKDLAHAISQLPTELEVRKTHGLLGELKRKYDNMVETPVVTDPSSEGGSNSSLTFPRKCDIFVPQACRILRYSGEERLESETTWDNAAIQEDLGMFLLSYLLSPYSSETPLIILGHPGSGKSLLTQILAARLPSEYFATIRVELRDVDADVDVPVQISQQLFQDTAREISWPAIADAIETRAAVIILDGYDELLQATGKVHAGYVQRVQSFQENERVIRRPVKTILTSRITLIDKAVIPKGSTVVRLLDFDEKRQSTWLAIWNRANQKYFNNSAVKPFRLPKKTTKIRDLAGQPLLLLMLAIYDSQANDLRLDEEMDQTALYNNLLRRFIGREKHKDKTQFRTEQQLLVETNREMERLGIVALGMFNRRAFHITGAQLDEDLKFFGFETPSLEGTGSPLSQAELLLGSFFFVHHAKVRDKAEKEDTKGESAYEFLHNTFGEFLVADFLLQRIILESKSLDRLRSDTALAEELTRKLNSPTGFNKKWFGGLIHTPLFTRPVVLEMMRSWFSAKAATSEIGVSVVVSELGAIVTKHISMILSERTIPEVLTQCGGEDSPYERYSLLMHIAIYTANLVLVQTVLDHNGWTLNEQLLPSHPDGARPWDRLTHLWRAWLSWENLEGFSSVASATRAGDLIHVRAHPVSATEVRRARLNIYHTVHLAIGDNIPALLSAFFATDADADRARSLMLMAEVMSEEKIDINNWLEAERFRLSRLQGRVEVDMESGAQLEAALLDAFHSAGVLPLGLLSLLSEIARNAQLSSDRALRGYAADLLFYIIRRGGPWLQYPGWLAEAVEALEDLAIGRFHIRLIYEMLPQIVSSPPPRIMLPILIRAARATGATEWMNHLYSLIREIDPAEMSPSLLVEAKRLAKLLGDSQHFKTR